MKIKNREKLSLPFVNLTDWKTGEVKMTRCPEKYGRQWRLKQGKSGWQKQKEKEIKEKVGRKQEEKENEKKQENQKKEKMIDVKRIAKKWEIWDEEEETARSEKEAKKLVPEKLYK